MRFVSCATKQGSEMRPSHCVRVSPEVSGQVVPLQIIKYKIVRSFILVSQKANAQMPSPHFCGGVVHYRAG